MKINELLTDQAVLSEFGKRITQHRLDLGLTQAALAEQAGIAKRTLERIEAGHSAQMATLVRVLRVLDGLSGLDRILAQHAPPGPIDILRRQGKVRQRASRQRPQKRDDARKPWSWGDET